jgi:hypothetical protein
MAATGGICEDDASSYALLFRAALDAHNKAHGVEATRKILDALFTSPSTATAAPSARPLFAAAAFRSRWADIADEDDD